jgi:hypothetical protein
MSETGDLDAVRRHVAAERGLDEAALAFIGGTTVDEIEASASRFVSLIGTREKSSSGPSGDLFADVARAQRARRDAIVALFVGRPAEQPRGDDGRYASFDGGAREQPARVEPESHEQWLSRILASRAADAGAHF